MHYLTSRPGYIRYITADSNFFVSNPWLQITSFAIVIGATLMVGQWREKKKRRVDDFLPIKKLLLLLTLLTLGSFLVDKVVVGKETDVWLCKEDKWVRQGNPPYEKPFDEECGVIDKAFGLE